MTFVLFGTNHLLWLRSASGRTGWNACIDYIGGLILYIFPVDQKRVPNLNFVYCQVLSWHSDFMISWVQCWFMKICHGHQLILRSYACLFHQNLSKMKLNLVWQGWHRYLTTSWSMLQKWYYFWSQFWR